MLVAPVLAGREGDYPDRRMVYFHSLDDVATKRQRLEAAIREWIEIKDS